MRIGIDAHMLGDHSGGNESFYEGILKAFVPDKENEYILFMKPGEDDTPYRDRFSIVRFTSGNAFIRNFVELTKLCKKYRLDILHTQYYIPFVRHCKTFVTIHDICFEHYNDIFTKSEYYRNKLLIPYAARHSDRIITVSEFSKNDIAKTYHIDEKKISVIYNAVSPEFRKLSQYEIQELNVREKYGIGTDKYLLCVGNLQPRKNIPRLIDAYIRLRKKSNDQIKLVVVGKNAWQYDEILKSAGKDKENVILTGYVDKDDLIGLINESIGFVYPSYFEGFGIPPLEAISCGTQVAVADIPVMHEVLGDAPIYFDPYDVEDMVDALHILSDGGEDKEVSKIYSAYSWENSARALNEAYNI